jgi:CheY-like chemotaxis protein
MNQQPLNIALADDDEDDRILFKEVIDETALSTNLFLFHDGQELMDYLNLPNVVLPDLIFLDLNMPIKDGLQCLKEIRRDPELNHILIAIYSTSSSDTDVEAAFVNGANIYITKPTNFTKLNQVVEKVLRMNWQYHTSNLDRETFLYRI